MGALRGPQTRLTLGCRPPLATTPTAPKPGRVHRQRVLPSQRRPARGGALDSSSNWRTGRELLKPGEVGNELRVYEEYPQHPEFGEGPWHLVPNGPRWSARPLPSRAPSASSRAPIGEPHRRDRRGRRVRYEQRVTLVDGLDRVDFRTRVLDFTGADRLLRVKFPVDVPGALPVSEVAGAVIGARLRAAGLRRGRRALDAGQPGQHLVRR